MRPDGSLYFVGNTSPGSLPSDIVAIVSAFQSDLAPQRGNDQEGVPLNTRVADSSKGYGSFARSSVLNSGPGRHGHLTIAAFPKVRQ